MLAVTTVNSFPPLLVLPAVLPIFLLLHYTTTANQVFAGAKGDQEALLEYLMRNPVDGARRFVGGDQCKVFCDLC